MSIVRPAVGGVTLLFLSMTIMSHVSALESPLPGALQAGMVPGAGVPMPHILTLREQAAFYNTSLKIRLEQIVPEIMRAEGVDLWLVICRENNEDPVYSSLVPFTTLYASRLADSRLP